jgi:hypothetical protein
LLLSEGRQLGIHVYNAEESELSIYEGQEEIVARVVAEVLQVRGFDIAPKIVDALIRVSFWASLESNEHSPCRFRIALVEPQDAHPILSLAEEQALTIDSVRRVAAGTQRSALIGVRQVGEQLRLWGVAHVESDYRLKVDCFGPGRLKVSVFARPFFVMEPAGSHRIGDGLASFVFSSLKGQQSRTWAATQEALATRVQVDASIRRILAAMIERGHGGTLIVLADATDLSTLPISGWGMRAEPASTSIPDLHEWLRQPPSFPRRLRRR